MLPRQGRLRVQEMMESIEQSVPVPAVSLSRPIKCENENSFQFSRFSLAATSDAKSLVVFGDPVGQGVKRHWHK